MQRIVLIDGENLVYGLRTLLADATGNKAARSQIATFNFRGLLEELLSDNPPSQILWFGARLQRYDDTPELREKSESYIHWQARFMNHIQAQKIQFIKVGYLRAREIDPCPNCGRQSWKLTEKGVDVGLAVRAVAEADDNTEIVIVSADTDLLPAFQQAKKRGAKLIHIGYEYRPIAALSRVADITRMVTLPLAEKYKNPHDA